MRYFVLFALWFVINITLQTSARSTPPNLHLYKEVSPIGSTIGYQIHSWDDLREWRQALKKGARWFKLDFNWPFDESSIEDRRVCSVQDNLSSKEKEDKRGCLLLTHDNPVETRTNYNTSNGVLELIAEPSYRHWFAGPERIYIAVCFKLLDSTNVCADSPLIHSWLSLLDDFFSSAQNVIDRHQLNIEFIVDGSATGGGGRECLSQRWRPLVATWISHRDPKKALWDNSKTDGSDRFQIMNLKVDDSDPRRYLEPMAVVDYGKFSKQNKYPYLMWEPDRQDVIQQVGQIYVDKGLAQSAGFKFAINIDIVHFQVFAANQSGQAWNIPLPSETSGKILGISRGSGVRIFQTSTTSNVTSLTVYSSSEMYGTLTEVSSIVIPNEQVTITSVSDRIVLSDGRGHVTEYRYNNDKLRLEKSWNTSMTLGVRPVRVNDLVYYYGLDSDQDCSVRLNELGSDGTVVSNTCLRKEGEHEHVTFSVLGSNHTSKTCPHSHHAIVAVATSTKGEIDIMLTCVIAGKDLKTSQTRGPVVIGVGRKPELSIASWKKTPHLMLVNTDGHCSNDLWRNTDAMHAVCDLVPVSEPKLLNYYYGRVEDWSHHIHNRGGIINSCHDHIMHGSYDMGDEPSVSIFEHQQGMLVISSHQGWNYNETEAAEKHCGLPTKRTGSVLDSWPLPSL